MKQEQHDSEQAACGFGATLRAALGAALFMGMVLGLVDGMIVYRSLGEVLELQGLLVGILLDCLGLGLVALVLAALLHGACLRERSVRARLWFFGAATLSIGLCLGLYSWRSAGLGRFELLLAMGASLAAGLFFGRAFASLAPRVHVAMRALALLLCLLGSLALPASEASAQAPLQQLRVNGVLTLVVPELNANQLAALPTMTALAERGATLLNVHSSATSLPERLAHFMSAKSTGFGESQPLEGGRREALPLQLRYLPANLEFVEPRSLSASAQGRRVLGRLTLFKLASEFSAWRGDDGLASEAVEWLGRQHPRPAWCVVMSHSSGEQAADELLASLMHSLDLAGQLDSTLVMVVGLASPSAFKPSASKPEEGATVILANTRLLPHGKRVEQRVGLIDVLPTVAELMALPDPERDGESFAEALLGNGRGEVPSQEAQ